VIREEDQDRQRPGEQSGREHEDAVQQQWLVSTCDFISRLTSPISVAGEVEGAVVACVAVVVVGSLVPGRLIDARKVAT